MGAPYKNILSRFHCQLVPIKTNNPVFMLVIPRESLYRLIRAGILCNIDRLLVLTCSEKMNIKIDGLISDDMCLE